MQIKDFDRRIDLDEVQAVLLTDDKDEEVAQFMKNLLNFESFTKKLQDPIIWLAHTRKFFECVTEK